MRRPATVLAMSTLMAGALGVAPFSVSMVRAAGKDSAPARATTPASIKSELEARGAVLNVRVDKTLALALADDAKFSIVDGADLIQAEVRDGLLVLKGLKEGSALLVLESPLQGTQRFVVKASPNAIPDEAERLKAQRKISLTETANNQTVIALTENMANASAISMTSPAQISLPRISPIAAAPKTVVPILPEFLPSMAGSTPVPRTEIQAPVDEAAPPVKAVEPLSTKPAIVPLSNQLTEERARAIAAVTTTNGLAQVSPNVPLPSADSQPVTTIYTPQSNLPDSLALAANDPSVNRPRLSVSRGMARVLGFKENILAVFFSDDNVMDARAVNARTLAVTGKSTGRSTLAIFLATSPDDVVGRAVIYNIDVYSPEVPVTVIQPGITDPSVAEAAIRTALSDPRVSISVIQSSNGELVAYLSGALRDGAEVEAAKAIAALYVPNVISSLHTTGNALTFSQASSGADLSSEGILQTQLRNLFSNDSIEIVSLPGSTALKATVDSPGQAEAILGLLPKLDRRIQPFIVIRGTPSGDIYTPESPILYGDDYEMTRSLKEVTGISTVYIKRTARNALAVYGTVRNRSEYDRVRRYAILLPQLQETAQSTNNTTVTGSPTTTTAVASTVSAVAPALAAANGTAPAEGAGALAGLADANAPNAGYQFPTQIQMFVSMLNEDGTMVRQVTVDSSVVEISRNALKDLGVQIGSVSLLSENITPATSPTVVTTPAGVTTVTGGTPGTVSRTIDPTFNQGNFQGGNGLIGTGGFSGINPIRARVAALMQNGAGKILSRPNLTTLEGVEAQITIGGVRPVPSTLTTGAGGGSSQTSVEFRRFGIILTMRPTVTDDDTIILQVRADITDLDFSTAINLNGAVVPGERVRSVDTTISMREGDTLVLGGLITNETRKQTSKVPFLGDIPFIGKLFQSKRFENNETELAIFLSPSLRRIAGSDELLPTVLNAPGFPKLRSVEEGQNTFGALSAIGGIQ